MSGNIPWGIDESTGYGQFDVRLHEGDIVIGYTDSLIEARTPDRQLLGQDGLLEIVQTLPVSDAAQIVPLLMAELTKRKIETDDDVTVLLFRPNGKFTKGAALSERVRGMGRMAAAVFRSLGRNGEGIPWPDLTLPNVGGAIFSPLSRLGRRK